MRRVVDAAEAGARDRMERKVLKAASMGYTKGVAAGRQAEAQESQEMVTQEGEASQMVQQEMVAEATAKPHVASSLLSSLL